MTSADEMLRQYLANGEMAENNADLLNGRITRPRAVTVQEVDAWGNPGTYRYEHDLQVACFQWADTAVADMQELEMLYAIPNGGHRHKSVAVRMKAEGQRAGVWDICLDVARGGYHSLKIELKVGKNKLTDSQLEWMERYTRYGHKTAVCYDLASFIETVTEYLAQ